MELILQEIICANKPPNDDTKPPIIICIDTTVQEKNTKYSTDYKQYKKNNNKLQTGRSCGTF